MFSLQPTVGLSLITDHHLKMTFLAPNDCVNSNEPFRKDVLTSKGLYFSYDFTSKIHCTMYKCTVEYNCV